MSCLYVASFLGHRASENLECYPKMRIFLNRKLKWKGEKIVYYFLDQKPLWPFLGIKKKNLTTFNFKLLAIVLSCIRKGSANFHIKIFIIKAPAIKKIKTLQCVQCARRNLPIFGNWPPKNIPDQQKHVAFQKSQKKCEITPPYCTCCATIYVHCPKIIGIAAYKSKPVMVGEDSSDLV